jgi:hypothetical protein
MTNSNHNIPDIYLQFIKLTTKPYLLYIHIYNSLVITTSFDAQVYSNNM